MPYINIPESTLSPIIIKLVSKIEADVRSKVQAEIEALVEEFKDTAICSNKVKLQNISKRKDTIQKALLSFKKRIDKIRKITDKLLAAAATINVIIIIIENLPIPSTPAITVGMIVSYSNKLQKAKEFTRQIKDDVTTINNIIAGAGGVILLISTVLQNLTIIDQAIQRCSQEELDNITDLTKEIKDTTVGSLRQENLIPEEDFRTKSQYFSTNGKEYILNVIEEESTIKSAPLRFVEAREKISNRIVLVGEKSFSSSVSVLIDEVKFRIDTELT